MQLERKKIILYNQLNAVQPAFDKNHFNIQDMKKRVYPDGTVKILYSDGRQETRYSNGRVRIKDPQGKLIKAGFENN